MRARLRPSTAAGLVPAAGAAFVLVLSTLSGTAGPSAGPSGGYGPAGAAGPAVVRAEVSEAAYAVAARAARPAPKRWLQIERTRRGYLVTAGLQHSRMRITETGRGLRIVDPGTAELREQLRGCERVRVRVGIGAFCTVSDRVTRRDPMRLGIVPRLGNDLVDTRSLSARFDVSVLADAGHDVVRLGDGDDFVNGYTGVDRVSGGRGSDWIRTGVGDDVITGGRGGDRLVGVEGDDVVRGGAGRDQVGGGPGRDRLYGGDGADSISCGDGRDHAWTDRGDTRRDCERLHR